MWLRYAKTLILSQVTDGEYWIDGSGMAMYADGDIGDYNHEAYVRAVIMSEYDIDLDDPNSPDITTLENPDFLRSLGMDEDQINVMVGLSDSREYAMKKWGWKRVMWGSVETETLTETDMRHIADGLWDAYGDEVEKMKFNVEVRTSGRYFGEVPFDVLAEGTPLSMLAFE